MTHSFNKHLVSLLFTFCFITALTGCSLSPAKSNPPIYTATYLDVFDTVTTVMGSSSSEEDFQQEAEKIHENLLNLHKLFDIYHSYDGIPNLKTINDQAGLSPVRVDPAIIALLLDCREDYTITSGKVNAAMGSVLSLWHDARSAATESPETALLPEINALREAALHTDFHNVIINESEHTVFLSDPKMRLDVGAIAKGWAAQRVMENAPSGLLLSVGGNVIATGPKFADGTPWQVGIQNPDGSGDSYLAAIPLTEGSMVTSGDYQRFFTVDGIRYHHIIDPDTLFPADYWRSVTVLCSDSGLADALSTALFTMTQEDGQKLLNRFQAQALWIDKSGGIRRSPDFPSD